MIEVMDYCTTCEKEIAEGQKVWQVGVELCCTPACLIDRLRGNAKNILRQQDAGKKLV